MIQKISTPTELAELGEFGLIDHLTGNFEPKNESTLKGVGDDCAVLDYGSEKKILVTTDLLVEGIHFDLVYCPLKHLGYKAVAVNLSDICAMNGIPRQITVSVALSSKFSLEAIEQLYEGIRFACQRYNVDLVGGDTSTSLTGLMISITAIGEVTAEDIVYRKGANVNDLICVSGDLGAAYMGLLLLQREKEVFAINPKAQPDLEGYDYILERQLRPEARTDVKELLAGAGVKPTSMIDISDGLSSEILHICKQSKKGCKIYADKFPLDPTTCNMAKEFNMAAEQAALNGGEDYELLFTVPLTDFEKVRAIPGISIIGSVTEESEGHFMIVQDGSAVALTAQGWNAYK